LSQIRIDFFLEFITVIVTPSIDKRNMPTSLLSPFERRLIHDSKIISQITYWRI